MSWGERSCQRPRIENGCKFATMATCNVDCPKYIWDGITRPDSVKSVTVADRAGNINLSPFEVGVDSGLTQSDGQGRKSKVMAKTQLTHIGGIRIEAIDHAIKLGCRRAREWFSNRPRCFGKFPNLAGSKDACLYGKRCTAYFDHCLKASGRAANKDSVGLAQKSDAFGLTQEFVKDDRYQQG